MKKIGFENFRSLKNIEDIEIKPLTVIVGKNSSGKSTFLRAFPLLKQSIETKTNSPILWYDPNFVDYGSYDECLNCKAKEENVIVFRYCFEMNSKHETSYALFFRKRKQVYGEINLEITITKEKDNEYVKQINLRIDESEINLCLSKSSIFESIVINGENLTPKIELHGISINSIIPQMIAKEKDNFSFNFDLVDNNIFKILGELTRKGTKKETLELMLHSFVIGGYEKFYKSFFKRGYPATWYERVKNREKNDPLFITLYNYFILSNLNHLLAEVDSYLSTYFGQVYYVAPVRATAERYYRIQGLAVNSIDPRGINLPMFLENQSKTDFLKFQKWTLENFKFEPIVSKEGGHLSISINIDNQKINLADTGFGFSQILPIITQLWFVINQNNSRNSSTKTFVIEQPELHLHPSIQALLIDTFINILNYSADKRIDLKIIFETHSETMINRIGQQIAYNNIKNDKINIVVFDTDGFETSTTTGLYDKKGQLKNWPFGFFYPDKISNNAF
ncbi:hypothetical protein EYV94_20565 [Puteibacter caeruleilacunae]|nr:hypothetical protein EYV94_20565 [Puteibacter caeruleilacunae]